MKSQNKGITLIALIVTIVITLILAVVTMNGIEQDGIVDRAEEARDSVNELQVKEDIQFALLKLQNIEDTVSDKEQWLEEQLKQNDEDATVTQNEDGTVTIMYKGYEASLDSDYNLQDITVSKEQE